MNDFFNARHPRPEREGDSDIPVTKYAVARANQDILDCVPEHKRSEFNTKIRTAAVQRHRWRNRGDGDFESIEQYKQFIYGTEGYGS